MEMSDIFSPLAHNLNDLCSWWWWYEDFVPDSVELAQPFLLHFKKITSGSWHWHCNMCRERERSSLTASLQVLHTDLSQLTFGVPIKVMSVEDGIREKGLVGGVKVLNALGPLCLWQCFRQSFQILCKACWSFCFEQKVLNESKYSMPWVHCAFGNVSIRTSAFYY